MLPAVVPNSRIILYNYESRWHSDAPRIRLQTCGEDFIRSVHTFRRDVADRLIIFIGHSLGGNVIQHVGIVAIDLRLLAAMAPPRSIERANPAGDPFRAFCTQTRRMFLTTCQSW